MKETEPTKFMDDLCLCGELEGPSSSSVGTVGKFPGKGQKKRKVKPLNMDTFLDTKATEGKYDFSEWVRAYCKFIDECLDTYYHSGWYTDLEKSGNESNLKSLPVEELIETLPRIQRIQRRLVDCKTTGGACQNDNTLLALSMVVRESFKLYKAISEGIINLADNFFKMDYYQGMKALEIYNEALQGGEELQKYHASLQQMEAVKRVIQFPRMEIPPSDFLQSMKDHLQEIREKEGIAKSSIQPLRRGKEAKIQIGLPELAEKLTKSDPGMFVAPLSRQISSASEEKPEAKFEKQPSAEVNIPEKFPKDLLEFESSLPIPRNDEKIPEGFGSDVKVVATPIDLLSELDFTLLHVEPDSCNTNVAVHDGAQSQMSSTNPIPDAFVMDAANQMFGNQVISANRKESTASVSTSSPNMVHRQSNNPFSD